MNINIKKKILILKNFENFNFMLVIVFNAARMISIEALNIQIHIRRDIPKRYARICKEPTEYNPDNKTDLNSNGTMVECKVVCV